MQVTGVRRWVGPRAATHRVLLHNGPGVWHGTLHPSPPEESTRHRAKTSTRLTPCCGVRIGCAIQVQLSERFPKSRAPTQKMYWAYMALEKKRGLASWIPEQAAAWLRGPPVRPRGPPAPHEGHRHREAPRGCQSRDRSAIIRCAFLTEGATSCECPEPRRGIALFIFYCFSSLFQWSSLLDHPSFSGY